MSKEILVKQTSIHISPYELGEVPALEKNLKIWDPIYYKYSKVMYHYNEKTKTLVIPRGIKISDLERLFNTGAKFFKAKKGKTIALNMTVSPRNKDQSDAIDFLSAEGDFRGTSLYSRLMLTLKPGDGKTYCGISTISRMRKRSAIIVNDNALLNQWEDRLYKFTDIENENIYIISGQDSINEILNFGLDSDIKVVLISHRTIAMYAKKHGWDSITELFKEMNIGVKIIDEAHKEFQNIIDMDLATNVYKTLYFTATADRNAIKEKKIYNTVFADIPNFFRKAKKEDNYINTLILQYDSNPSPMIQAKCKTKLGFNSQIYMGTIEKDRSNLKLFLKCIDSIINSVYYKLGKGEKMAILLLRRSLVKSIREYILSKYKDINSDDIGIFTSDITDKEEKEEQKNRKIILSTSKSMGTGVDVNGLRVLVMAEPYSSANITTKQTMGRLRNIGGELIYIEIVNVGFSKCREQFEKRKPKILSNSKKLTVIKIKGDD